MAAVQGKTLRDVLPHEAHDAGSYPAMTDLLDQPVASEWDGRDPKTPWPGRRRNVNWWWTLVDGRRVGWNENPASGWSFPILGKARGPRKNRGMARTVESVDMLSKATPVPEAGCWLWLGSVSPDGYGRVIIGGKKVLAHRVAWEQVRGPIPQGMCVCHKCDTPACVNPSHLWLGTHTENMRDMSLKGRGRNHASATNRMEAKFARLFLPKPLSDTHDGLDTRQSEGGFSFDSEDTP